MDASMKDAVESTSMQDHFANNHEDEDLFQDVMSQFPGLNGFQHIVLGFVLPPTVTDDQVATALKNGLNKLLTLIPWLSGQIEHIPGSTGTSGTNHPTPWPVNAPPPVLLDVKDCRGTIPSMAQLLRTHAPFGSLDGNILAPWPGIPQAHGIEGPIPIFKLQANFIRGGLLLNLTSHHQIFDGTGALQLIRLLGLAINGPEIPAADIEQANRDRHRVVPLIPLGEPVKDHSHFRRPPDFTPGIHTSPPEWSCSLLPVSALSTLKKQVTSELTSAPQSLSDDDVICAFCWQRISAVRLARNSPKWTPQTVVKFVRSIDGRMAMGIPTSYMGHLVYYAVIKMPLGQVVSSSLSTIALALRRQLNAVNTEWAIRSFATFIAREPDKSTLMFKGVFDPTIDMSANSFAAGAGDAREGTLPHFGPMLGKARFVRRPNTSPHTSTITIVAAERSNIPVILAFPKEDLDALKDDPMWRRYMKVVD